MTDKESKVWVTASATINLGEYNNIKIEAGFSMPYGDKDPIEVLSEQTDKVTKLLNKKAKALLKPKKSKLWTD